MLTGGPGVNERADRERMEVDDGFTRNLVFCSRRRSSVQREDEVGLQHGEKKEETSRTHTVSRTSKMCSNAMRTTTTMREKWEIIHYICIHSRKNAGDERPRGGKRRNGNGNTPTPLPRPALLLCPPRGEEYILTNDAPLRRARAMKTEKNLSVRSEG